MGFNSGLKGLNKTAFFCRQQDWSNDVHYFYGQHLVLNDRLFHVQKILAVLLPVPSPKCCGELSWNLNARKYGYPLYWKGKTRVNVLCSYLSLATSINFFLELYYLIESSLAKRILR